MQELSPDFVEAWRRFQSIDSLRLLQETLEWEWTRGRTDYVAFLIAISDEDARRHVASQIAPLEGIPGVRPYPESYWHITVKGVGFLVDEPKRSDEVSWDEVKALSEAARPVIEAMPAFEVTLGPVSGFAEVVILEVHDGGTVRGMNQRLMEALPSVPRYPVDGDIFLPHVSIARFESNDGLLQLKETLAGMRNVPETFRFRASEVLLIQAHLADAAPVFDLLTLYKLRE